jgi:hypothetical protein
VSHEELAAVAEAIRISTREAQGLPERLTSDEPFQLVASLMRVPTDAKGGDIREQQPLPARPQLGREVSDLQQARAPRGRGVASGGRLRREPDGEAQRAAAGSS